MLMEFFPFISPGFQNLFLLIPYKFIYEGDKLWLGLDQLQ